MIKILIEIFLKGKKKKLLLRRPGVLSAQKHMAGEIKKQALFKIPHG